MIRFSWKWKMQLLAVLLCALGLKAFYSAASVDQLRWILAPTTFLVELLTNSRFAFESRAGYINSEHTFVVAASCAGVNFLIAGFLMLTVRQLWRNHPQAASWKFIPLAAVVAYVTTIVANTIRIAIALEMRAGSVNVRGLNAEQLHRLEGVLVYFGFLLLLFLFAERIQDRSQMRVYRGGFSFAQGAHFLRASLFPLVIYYVTTLGMPFLNGAYRSSEFWEHTRFVLLAPLVFVVPLACVSFLKRSRRKLFHAELT